jgi:hypothetical protein
MIRLYLRIYLDIDYSGIKCLLSDVHMLDKIS